MRKIFLTITGLVMFSLALSLSTSTIVFAANNVTLNPTTNVYISALGITLTITGNVDTIAVDSSTITLTTCAACTVRVESSDKKILNNTKEGLGTICESSYSYLNIYTASSESITITPSSDVCTATTGGGGGGGTTVTTPSNTSITINNDAATTSSREVTLNLTATNASLMLISNNSDFSDVTVWEDFAESKSWTLTEGEGEKTVHVKFRSSSGGESSVVSDSITYSPPAVSEVGEEEEEPTSPAVTLEEGSLVKEPGKPSVYLVENGLLRPIPNANIFEANNFDWNSIIEVSLSGYEIGEDLGYPEDYDFTDGMLVKGSSANVYVISNGQRRWIQTEEIFNALGYKWSKVHNISDAKLGTYPEGNYITSSDSHPDGTLIKYATSTKVYLIEAGKKRWIVSEEAFNNAGYDWDNIIEVPDTETYPDGDNIGGTVLGVETTEVFVSYLTLGSVGDEVRLLQDKLKELGFFPLDVKTTGYYGWVTREAVIDFQKANSIDPLGVVGPATRELLNSLY